ncbi:MAG: YggT family protein [Candidatus Omnitrophica bacterium]|jgi:YggT family protein|nr:YggT family protein [Candidatus Omnitrophota bacterium]
MFVLANFITAVAQVLSAVLSIYSWIIIIRALISWVNPDPYNPIVVFLHRVTDPVLEPLRRLLPPERLGGIDISPILALLAIMFTRFFLINSLYDIAAQVR